MKPKYGVGDKVIFRPLLKTWSFGTIIEVNVNAENPGELSGKIEMEHFSYKIKWSKTGETNVFTSWGEAGLEPYGGTLEADENFGSGWENGAL